MATLAEIENWTMAKKPPSRRLVEDVFDHLILYRGKTRNRSLHTRRVQQCLEFIVPLLAPERLDTLNGFADYDLRDKRDLLRLLTGTKDVYTKVCNGLKYNTPPASEYDHPTPPVVKKGLGSWEYAYENDEIVRAHCYSSTIGIGLCFVWSPSLAGPEAAEAKKRLGLEVANLPGVRWRLEYLYCEFCDQPPESTPMTYRWLSCLEEAFDDYITKHWLPWEVEGYRGMLCCTAGGSCRHFHRLLIAAS